MPIPEVNKILVPVDYSEYSVLACRYAAKMVKSGDTRLKLFHSFYSPAYDLIELTGNKNTQTQLRNEVTRKLLTTEHENIGKFIKDIQKFPEIKDLPPGTIDYELKPGLPKDLIFEYTEEYKPDLVVMGTRGKDRKANSLFGSVTEIVLKKLKFPVLTIPEEYQFIGKKNLERVIYLTDFDESDFISIKKLMRFTRLLNLSIHCIHIGPKTGQWEMVRMEGLKDYFQKAYDKTAVECKVLVKKKDLLQDLNDYILENKINMISLTIRKRNLIEKAFKPSLTKRLFYHTSIPLLVFHS